MAYMVKNLSTMQETQVCLSGKPNQAPKTSDLSEVLNMTAAVFQAGSKRRAHLLTQQIFTEYLLCTGCWSRGWGDNDK